MENYPIIYKCRLCKREFDYLDVILSHIQKTHKLSV